MELKSNITLKNLMKSYFHTLGEASSSADKKVAWCTSVGPAEILLAFGYNVYFPENHGALIGVTRKASDYIPYATAYGYSSRICSYLTSDIGSYLKRETPLSQAYDLQEVPKPDLLVANDNQCREVEEWFSFYAREYEVPLLVIRNPKFLDNLEEHHLDCVEKEMENLVHRLEEINKTKLDKEHLAEIIKLSAEATQYWKNVLNIAQNKPAPFLFFDGVIHMGPIVTMRGTQECLDYYKLLYEELLHCARNGQSAVTNEVNRLYWDGMPVWGRLRKMSEVFKSLDSAVVASTYCNSWIFDSLDPDNPIRSMAKAYCEIFINRSEAFKEKYLLDICKQFDVQGIVYHDAMTCPYNSNNHFALAERVKEKSNLPYLVIDGDLNDLRCFSEEQSIIKIETFIEQLRQRQ
jgi:benzoyl-CoA reductase/2-hydroxyglutaryl-CoA dehydratase subunit BcrC/BadD/HgdB